MNKKISIISSIILAATIIIFFISLGLSLIERRLILDIISFGACIVLSWSYVITVIGSSRLCDEDKVIAAEAGKVFGIIYSIFVTLVYFTQLTVIKNDLIPLTLVDVFDYTQPDSWMFSINLIGYGIMALSTFFVGLTIEGEDKNSKILRVLLLVHGTFVVCIFMPMTSIFLGNSNHVRMGTIVLMCWCVMFLPIALLFIKRFGRSAVL